MKIISPSFEIIDFTENALEKIERAGRNCYLSEPQGDAEGFVSRLIKSGHETPLEVAHASIRMICDRGVMAEITRHRLCSFSIQSTRYVNYSKEKFGGEISVVKPLFWEENSVQYELWKAHCESSEFAYMSLIEFGATAQEARSVLPTSTATNIIMTANFREFRHIFDLRCSPKSHPQMVEILTQVRDQFISRWPILFNKNGDK